MDDATLDLLADRLADRLAERLETRFRDSVRRAVREEVTQVLCGGQQGDEFFERLNQEIMGRLSDIYKELGSVQNGQLPPDPGHAAQAGELMAEASQRLDQVIQATEKATFEIIELVERNLSVPDQLAETLADASRNPAAAEAAGALCGKLSADLIQIMTCLSFQDLTGQRIKRVIDMLSKVRSMIEDLYLSTGMLMKAREKDPKRPLEQLREIAVNQVSQSDVDSLLAQLSL